MASTIAFYTGDGATTDFTVPFDYLAKKFVRVSLDVTILKGGDYGDTSKDYYFLDKTKVRLKVPPQVGEVLTIRRYTSTTDRVVSFKDASVLKATDLDVSAVQTIHIAEEARDIINDALIKDKEGNWNAKGIRIINVGDAVSDGDAVNLKLYKEDAKGAYQSRIEAEKARDRAIEAVTNAKESEGKASASAELAKQWATKLDATVDGAEYSAKYYVNKANEVLTQVATDVVNRVTAEGTKQVDLVSNQGTTSVNAVKAQQTASVNAVVTQQGTSVKAVQTQQTTSVNAVTAEGTKQVGLVSTEGTKQVDLAKAQVTIATQSASTATAEATIATQQATLATTKASEAEDSATAASADATKAEASATNAANSAGTATTQATAASNSAKAAELSADNAALAKTAAGTSEVNAKASEVEAKKQADIAKQYADQAVAGQLQADWAQTNSTEIDFIKNKPTLGALASKDSVAYSEITGTPPEQDLSGLATKTELQTGLAGKANSSHTHTVSQITDMPRVVLSVNGVTPDDSGSVFIQTGLELVRW